MAAIFFIINHLPKLGRHYFLWKFIPGFLALRRKACRKNNRELVSFLVYRLIPKNALGE